MRQTRSFRNPEDLLRESAETFLELGMATQKQSGVFRILLSGGKTPVLFHNRLRELAVHRNLDWARVKIFFSDERCVPEDHPDSTFRATRDALMTPLYIPEASVYKIDGQKPPEKAASEYETVLRQFFEPALPRFDLALLGFGLDGHVASLFPHRESLLEKKRWVLPGGLGPEGLERVTLTYPVLNSAKNVWFLSLGAEKTRALNRFFENEATVWDCPLLGVRPRDGRLVFWTEETKVDFL